MALALAIMDGSCNRQNLGYEKQRGLSRNGFGEARLAWGAAGG